jgi:hypothetical protein
MYVRTYVCMYVCTVCMYVCLFVCMYVCTVCMFVCVYCMYVLYVYNIMNELFYS